MAMLFLTPFDDVGVGEGPLFQVNTEDGPVSRYNFFVEMQTRDRKLFRLTHPFSHRQDAERQVERVKARGCLNLDHWVEVDTMSLEDKFDLYAQHEWEVGHGYRAPHDLYHGIP